VIQLHHGPAVPELLRLLSGEQWPTLALEYSVPADPRPCAHCGQPFVESQGGTGREATLGIDASAPSDEEGFRWYHPTCALTAANARITAMAVGMAGRSQGFTNPEHPDCARCGLPWDDHGRYGWPSRQCEDGGFYHHAFARRGVKTPAWVRIAA
jgi:hypothetical protein